MIGRVRRSFGRTAVSVRAAHAVLAVQWRDASRADRLQLVAAGALALLVFGLFAVGAATRAGGGRDANRLALSADERPDADRPAAAKRRPGADGDSGGGSSPAGGAGASPTSGALPAAGDDTDAADTPAAEKKRKPRRPPTPAAAESGAGGSTPHVLTVVYRVPSAAADLAEALGLDDAPGDTARQARAVADWVKAHGGMGGRPLELRLAPYDPSGLTSSFASAFETACVAAAGGALRSLAAVGTIEDAPAQSGCLASKGVPLVGDSPAPGDREAFEQAGPHLFALGSMALDRLATGYVRVLAREGFLAKGARVGILRLDGAVFARAAERALRPGLQEAGATVAAEAVLPRARTAAEAPALVTRAIAAVLSFRAAGVERVVVLDAGLATPVFMREAERLGFRPRYGLNSSMVPAGLPTRVPAAQLRGALGAGFAPLLDVAKDGEPDPNSERRRCEDIYRAADVPTGERTAGGQFAAIALCDAILTLKAATERLKGTGAPALAAALEATGERRASAVALEARLGPGRHDAAAQLRPLRFDEGCACVRYSGPAEAAR